MRRDDDYQTRRAHLADLSDEALHERFWTLARQLVEPMLETGRHCTTPAIERSVLLRMGFSSVEAKPIVDGVMARGLMGKGCGGIVWRLAQQTGRPIRETGAMLAAGQLWDDVERLFAKPDDCRKGGLEEHGADS